MRRATNKRAACTLFLKNMVQNKWLWCWPTSHSNEHSTHSRSNNGGIPKACNRMLSLYLRMEVYSNCLSTCMVACEFSNSLLSFNAVNRSYSSNGPGGTAAN